MIPDYQTLMLPVLETISDNKEYRMTEVINSLAQKYKLSEEERSELIPSGQTPLY
jgi:restriction system protein